MKSGNNLVLEFSTAAYEYARQCLITILDCSTQYTGMVRHSEETFGAKIDTCIKVFNRKTDNSQGKNLNFFVNLYNTSSTMVFNGSRVDLYLADIHELLCDELSKKGHMLTSLNDNITSTISKFISTVPNLNQNLAAANTNYQDNLDDLAIAFRADESKDLNEDTTDICPICNRISLLETIKCSECSLLIHDECAGLLQSAVSALNSLDFVCALCTDNMLYEVVTNVGTKSQNLHSEMNSLVVNDTSPDTYVRPPSPPTTLPEFDKNSRSGTDLSDETTLAKEVYNQHDTVDQANAAKDNHSQHTGNQCYGATPKIKFENEINKLQSTIELQNSLRHQNEQPEAASFSTNCTQKPSSNNLNCNHHNNNRDEQMIRMIEMQMMQNMSINNTVANRQMQIMMQQQQMMQQQKFMQQSPLQPNHDFSMYQHMTIPRHVPPPPGFVPNIIPNVPVRINHHPLQYQHPLYTHYSDHKMHINST
ncbi:unnamed protein product [Mytilus coruscus]|uniref:Zinc finger PHD-type domain-containing protein n=1 Tax=Mytilus coruscus TaxID=42192 RepID=A0A6J8BK01_MYTCO|nr:unnamed protein product [Mytilus coruscus]